MAADGTIRIDTRVDARGINTGTKEIARQTSGLSSGINKLMTSFRRMAVAAGLLFSAAAIGNYIQKSIGAFDLLSSAFGRNIENVTNAFDELQGAVANLGLVIFSALAPYIIIAVEWLTKMLTTLAQIIAYFFGVSTAVTAATQALDKFGKKGKGSLATFDELNVLAKPQDQLPVLPPIDPALIASIEAFKDAILGFFGPAIQAFGEVYEALKPFIDLVWDGLVWIWDNILVPLGEWGAQVLLPAVLSLIAAGIDLLTNAAIALQPLWQWFWDNVLKPVAEALGKAIVDAIEWLTVKLNELSAWIEANPEKFRTFVAVLLIVVGAILAAIAILYLLGAAVLVVTNIASVFAVVIALITDPVFLAVAAITALILVVVALIYWWPEISAAAGRAWDWIVEQWGKLANWFNDNVVEPLKEFFEPMWDFFGILIHDYIALFNYLWSNILSWFKDNIIDTLVEFFVDLWQVASDLPVAAWKVIKDLWALAPDWFKDIIGTIVDAFGFAWDAIGEHFSQTFENIKTIAKTIINGIIGFINLLIYAVTGAINAIIFGLNAIGTSVPDWIIIPSVEAPEIPYLAKGAVIPPNAQFAAILGDQTSGRNIEAPEALIRQIVSEEIGKIEADIRIEFSGSLAALVRELKPYVDRENVRVGRSLIRSETTI